MREADLRIETASSSANDEATCQAIPVLCTADDAYAMPLAVTLVSAARSLESGSRLQVWLVDGGIGEQSMSMLRESVADYTIDLNIVDPAGVDLRDLSISHHISHTAYLRLLADRWLPDDLTGVLYLDSDLVVRESLTRLWTERDPEFFLAAIPDIACPWIDARQAGVNFRRSSPYMAVWEPVPNYRDMGMQGERPYFNSGVMMLNLDAWRSENLGVRLLDCLRNNQKHVWCWDQYALNCVMRGRWQQLPGRWNVGSHAWEYPSIGHSPIDPSEFSAMIANPAIIHFTTEWKPWHFGTRHPLKNLFFENLDFTAWRGWRPQAVPFSVGRTWQSAAVATTKQATILYRKLANRFVIPALASKENRR